MSRLKEILSELQLHKKIQVNISDIINEIPELDHYFTHVIDYLSPENRNNYNAHKRFVKYCMANDIKIISYEYDLYIICKNEISSKISSDITYQVSSNNFANVKLVCKTLKREELVFDEKYEGSFTADLWLKSMVSVFIGITRYIYPIEYFEIIDVEQIMTPTAALYNERNIHPEAKSVMGHYYPTFPPPERNLNR